jgi:hypothetical protein
VPPPRCTSEARPQLLGHDLDHLAGAAILGRPAAQFDPLIAPYYMGDYLANVSDGGRQYFAWGDNRDRVRNWLYPNGRHDPNIYFARR